MHPEIHWQLQFATFAKVANWKKHPWLKLFRFSNGSSFIPNLNNLYVSETVMDAFYNRQLSEIEKRSWIEKDRESAYTRLLFERNNNLAADHVFTMITGSWSRPFWWRPLHRHFRSWSCCRTSRGTTGPSRRWSAGLWECLEALRTPETKKNVCFEKERPHKDINLFVAQINTVTLGIGCGLVGRAVASKTRGLRFEFRHRQNFMQHLFTVNCILLKRRK